MLGFIYLKLLFVSFQFNDCLSRWAILHVYVISNSCMYQMNEARRWFVYSRVSYWCCSYFAIFKVWYKQGHSGWHSIRGCCCRCNIISYCFSFHIEKTHEILSQNVKKTSLWVYYYYCRKTTETLIFSLKRLFWLSWGMFQWDYGIVILSW